MKTPTLTSLLLLFILSTQILFAQNTPEERKNLQLLMLTRQALAEVHFQEKELNDELSLAIFDNYLKSLDYFKRFLIQEDIDTLDYYKTLVDDQIRYSRFSLFNLAVETVEKRINESEKYYKEALSKPFNYSLPETIEMDRDKIGWASNKKELQNRWRKVLKYETLAKIYQEEKNQETAMEKHDTIIAKPFDTIELHARESILKRYDNWFKRLHQMDKDDRFSDYLNAYAITYDPHTAYFPPKDKEDFDIRFSGKLEGIGATLQARDGYVTVANIVPGSPSWKQGDLEVDDKITEVAQGEKEPVNIVDMRLDKAVKLIRGEKGTEVRLTVKKLDGSTKIIPIIRDLVIIEETYAKSLIIEDTVTKKRIGYIMLPSFYADFSNTNGRNCGKDMAKEIRKLKAEGVDGMIVDLRNNGGGSLPGAIEIAGHFIDKGPIVQVKTRDNSIKVHKDYVSGQLYDGPLAIMVNGSSASASEILAAALQDYKRAIIIGGKSTFGKGTVQRFLDYDAIMSSRTPHEPLGALKITMQKFYRVNGGSTQLKGVTPDIAPPDNYKYIDFGEKEYDNAMNWSEITPSVYEPIKNNYPIFAEVISRSESRTSNDSIFMKYDINGQRLKKNRDQSNYNLDYITYKNWRKELDLETEQFKKIGKDTLEISIYSLAIDLPIIEKDSVKNDSRTKWINQLTKDNYLFETVKIVEDIGTLTAKLEEK